MDKVYTFDKKWCKDQPLGRTCTMNSSSGRSISRDALVLGWGAGARAFGCQEEEGGLCRQGYDQARVAQILGELRES